MRRIHGELVYSPSDLCTFLESPFTSWMDRYDIEFPGEMDRDPDRPEDRLLQRRGDEHERAYLETLSRRGLDVLEINREEAPFAQTRRGMREGRDILYQAELRGGRFRGYADFLRCRPGSSRWGEFHYTVWDTKLARTVKPTTVIQLCCYAEMLESMQGTRPGQIGVVLGNGREETLQLDRYDAYYRALRATFLEVMDHFDPEAPPTPDPASIERHWGSRAARRLDDMDHLSAVAGITQGQIRKLNRAGIDTVTALAQSSLSRIPRLDEVVLRRLREQASLQQAAVEREPPPFRILAAREPPREEYDRRPWGLERLPPSAPRDVYFDIEGYPFYPLNLAAEPEGSLEYLFGAVTVNEEGEWTFHDWWSHDPVQERAAFEGLIDWLHDRWLDNPEMHVYHYAPYEVTALRRLMGRHGTREAKVDDLLRNRVFVDIYKVFREGVRVGTPDYSLKQVERLYRGARSGEVNEAVGSVVAYEEWLRSGEPPDWQDSERLREIRDYNQDDCESLVELVTWLRTHQEGMGLTWRPERSDDEPNGLPEHYEEPVALSERLLARALADPATPDLDRLLGHLLLFFYREIKPLTWAKYERHAMSEAELREDLHCLGGLRRTDDPPVTVKRSKVFRYAFAPQDTRISAGTNCFLAHDLDVRVTVEDIDMDAGRARLKLGPTSQDKLGGPPPDTLSLIPDEFVPTKYLEAALKKIARGWLEDRQLPSALHEFLRRRRPRLRSGDLGDLESSAASPTDAVREAVANLDHSTLFVQGPPGTGKTYTAARSILDLLQRHKRVGITSNSHKAVHNLLVQCQEQSETPLQVLKVGGDKDDPLLSNIEGLHHEAASRKGAEIADRFPLVAGTAWLFSQEAMVDQLDVLFVDEAGQVSLAHLVAMSRCAKNLVLIGDQMQLAQPTQGAHPGESGLSTLEYLLGDETAIPPDRGIFLDTTYRMHPEIAGFLSEVVYSRTINSAPGREFQVVELAGDGDPLVSLEAGILFLSVEHTEDDGPQSKDSEAEMVERVVADLLGRGWTDHDQQTRPLAEEDLLVVAPYNLQVLNLRQRLPAAVRVGTVDKFQGQQAPVVIVSTCIGPDVHESPRGLDFLLHLNRLNVALSRARSLAVVVADRAASRVRCSTLRQMRQVNRFCRLAEEGTAWSA